MEETDQCQFWNPILHSEWYSSAVSENYRKERLSSAAVGTVHNSERRLSIENVVTIELKNNVYLCIPKAEEFFLNGKLTSIVVVFNSPKSFRRHLDVKYQNQWACLYFQITMKHIKL